MSLPHFFVEGFVDPVSAAEISGLEARHAARDLGLDAEPVALSEADSRHALRSLRLSIGDGVTVADGSGVVSRGRLVGADARRARVRLDEVWFVRPSRPTVSVALAPPKGDRLAWAIQKLTEIGVDETILIATDRTVRSFPGGRGGSTVDRLAAIAREAAMQSRRPRIMGIGGPVSLMEQAVGEDSVLLHHATAERLSSVLPDDRGRLHLVVGPEGGFTDSEVERARSRGCLVASLGPGILRTETAAVVGAALVLATYGRLG